jgi:hypothetical protein
MAYCLRANHVYIFKLCMKHEELQRWKLCQSMVQGVQKVTKPMGYLESVFPVRLISKRLWPPRSPELKPPRLLFMGHLKDAVYSNHPHTHTHTLQELQANIQRTVDSISTGTLQNVFVNMVRHVLLLRRT